MLCCFESAHDGQGEGGTSNFGRKRPNSFDICIFLNSCIAAHGDGFELFSQVETPRPISTPPTSETSLRLVTLMG
jgi:hypothetical protein